MSEAFGVLSGVFSEAFFLKRGKEEISASELAETEMGVAEFGNTLNFLRLRF